MEKEFKCTYEQEQEYIKLNQKHTKEIADLIETWIPELKNNSVWDASNVFTIILWENKNKREGTGLNCGSDLYTLQKFLNFVVNRIK